MEQRVHDDELDTSEQVVRELLSEQCPELATLPLSHLRNSGTTNALWRIHRSGESDCVLRLPRMAGGEASIVNEVALLPALASTSLAELVELPVLRHHGEPAKSFPLHWAVLEWIDGEDAWTERTSLASSARKLTIDLAAAVQTISSLTDLPVPDRSPGTRGGPLGPLLERLYHWIDDPQWCADGLIDVAAVRRCAARSAEVIDEPASFGFVHGDLIPGNILVSGGRLSSIIDWGGAGHGDTAQDLAPAWAIFDATEREVFRNEIGVDDAAWLRARAFELEHAVGGVLYYVPRGHTLGDVMARTLERVLSETS